MNPESETESTQPPVDVAIVVALSLEAAPLLESLDFRKTVSGNGLKYRNCFLGEQRIVVCEGAVGQKRARQATDAVIDAFDPQWILSVGISGGMIDGMKIGNIAVANSVVATDHKEEIEIPVGMPSDPKQGLYVDRICTASEIVRTGEEKRTLHEKTKAIAVDMESFAVVQTARKRDKNVMAIRAISDTLDVDLPPEVLAIFGEKGTIRTGALVGSIFKRPGSVKDLWKIRENAVHASESLAKFVIGVIPQLTRSVNSKKE